MSLTIFPLRNVPIESDVFLHISQYIVSLGDAALPSLIAVLDTEQDRSMRKKLCHLITLVAREAGADFLIESLKAASSFLVRNIIMILGDLKPAKANEMIAGLIHSPLKIVRIEALRSLCKIGTDEATRAITKALTSIPDIDGKKLALDYLVQKKETRIADTLIRLAKEDSIPADWRRSLYTAIAVLGGAQARQYLESIVKGISFLGRFSSEQREDVNLVKSLLAKMAS
jgi:HEAT repeat protein